MVFLKQNTILCWYLLSWYLSRNGMFSYAGSEILLIKNISPSGPRFKKLLWF